MKQILYLCGGLLALLLVIGSGVNWLVNSTTYQVAGEMIPRVATDEKVVALTFDDGPTQYTDEILHTLAEKGVTATFYLVGREIAKDSQAAIKIVNAGHEIGNHTYSHRRMIFKSDRFIAREIEATSRLINIIGYTANMTFRPPYGKKLLALPAYLERNRLKTIMWDVEPLKALGGNPARDAIVEYVQKQTRSGSIILIHPWYGDTNPSREAIAPLIDALHADGYRFVTVSELLDYQDQE